MRKGITLKIKVPLYYILITLLIGLFGLVSFSFSKDLEPEIVDLSWTSISSATKYRVEIALDQKFNSNVKTMEVLEPHLNWKPKALGTFFWRVAAIDSQGTLGEASEIGEITVRATPPRTRKYQYLFDSNNTQEVHLELKWHSNRFAKSYEIELAPSTEAFDSKNAKLRARVKKFHAKEKKLQIKEFPKGSFYWRVRALGDDHEPIGRFSVAQLVQPPIHQENQWKPPARAPASVPEPPKIISVEIDDHRYQAHEGFFKLSSGMSFYSLITSNSFANANLSSTSFSQGLAGEYWLSRRFSLGFNATDEIYLISNTLLFKQDVALFTRFRIRNLSKTNTFYIGLGPTMHQDIFIQAGTTSTNPIESVGPEASLSFQHAFGDRFRLTLSGLFYIPLTVISPGASLQSGPDNYAWSGTLGTCYNFSKSIAVHLDFQYTAHGLDIQYFSASQSSTSTAYGGALGLSYQF